jgi:glucosamine 6-phosphate synthetase-like amidotransferase/phosphosugar isomerase protein
MSGELKHGPLAMVDKVLPIVMIITKDRLYQVSWWYSPYQNLSPKHNAKTHLIFVCRKL